MPRASRSTRGTGDSALPFMAWRRLTPDEKEAYTAYRLDLDPELVNYWWIQEKGNISQGVPAANYLKEASQAWRDRVPAYIEQWKERIREIQ